MDSLIIFLIILLAALNVAVIFLLYKKFNENKNEINAYVEELEKIYSSA